ncbi:MAG: hypothetical protein KJP21_01255 [Bacteroidia bacterium]|nr:hypothetical protein [Bacteroidia bacterium]NNJ56742.1 hypothetical protein [Bacteroidia bacterium]
MTKEDSYLTYYKREIIFWQDLERTSNLILEEAEFTEYGLHVVVKGEYQNLNINFKSGIRFQNVSGGVIPVSSKILGESKLIIDDFSQIKFKIIDELNFRQSLATAFGWNVKRDHLIYDIYYKKRKPQLLEMTLNELFLYKVKWIENSPEKLESKIFKHLSPKLFKEMIETLLAVRRGFERIL